jgi:hypothetical protein
MTGNMSKTTTPASWSLKLTRPSVNHAPPLTSSSAFPTKQMAILPKKLHKPTIFLTSLQAPQPRNISNSTAQNLSRPIFSFELVTVSLDDKPRYAALSYL